MGGLRKGKLIAGGYWIVRRIKISQKNSVEVTTLSTSVLLNKFLHTNMLKRALVMLVTYTH